MISVVAGAASGFKKAGRAHAFHPFPKLENHYCGAYTHARYWYIHVVDRTSQATLNMIHCIASYPRHVGTLLYSRVNLTVSPDEMPSASMIDMFK
jgi:hypothetical protein